MTLTYSMILLLFFIYTSFGQLQKMLTGHGMIYQHRNYYGIMRVLDSAKARLFIHGGTIHGGQYLDPKRQDEPLIYYGSSTPIGSVLKNDPLQFKNIAVIGLGVGSLAAYTEKHQKMDFYELDPDVYKAASKYFTFLRNAKGRIEHILGDARLSIKNSTQVYDAIIIDAFGSDAIPVHLITVEAIEEYRKHLSKDGILFFHFSNIFLDLLPVIKKNAQTHHAYCSLKSIPSDPNNYINSSDWAALYWNEGRSAKLQSLGWKNTVDEPLDHIEPWTDNFSNILPFIRLRNLNPQEIQQLLRSKLN
jgi:hypothetical protein